MGWVRIHRDGRAEAVGVAHRLPTACPVTLETALALARDGVPLIMASADDT